MITQPTYSVDIYIGGDHANLAPAVQRYVDSVGLCVTVTPTTFHYTNGAEPGVVVGLKQYPRFPKRPEDLDKLAVELAQHLCYSAEQQTALVVTPATTYWLREGTSTKIAEESPL